MGELLTYKDACFAHFKSYLIYSFNSKSTFQLYLYFPTVLRVEKGLVMTESCVETLKWDPVSYKIGTMWHDPAILLAGTCNMPRPFLTWNKVTYAELQHWRRSTCTGGSNHWSLRCSSAYVTVQLVAAPEVDPELQRWEGLIIQSCSKSYRAHGLVLTFGPVPCLKPYELHKIFHKI